MIIRKILLGLCLILASCSRRPLEEILIVTAKIPVKVNWHLAEIAPKNATIIAYRSDGTLYKEFKVSSAAQYANFELDLEQGSYTLVAFNELRDQIDNVRMRGVSDFNTLEAYITTNNNLLFGFENIGKQVHEPGILAATTTTLIVTTDMISTSRKGIDTLEMFADRKTAQANMIVAVKGLNNARMPAAAQLRNMASSYFFATDRNSLTPVCAQFTMNNRTYDRGSMTDGTISAQISTFGVLGEWHHIGDTPDAKFYLDLAFMLVDAQKSIVQESVDITNIMEIIVDSNITVNIYINVDASPLPTVKPEGGVDSGFNTELVDWDRVEIPL